MKRRINRETAIGLSVLLLLLVILVGVAVWRFTRPNLPPEAVAAREESKHEEEHLKHLATREADSLQKPDLLTPIGTENRVSLKALDEPGHWDTARKERRKETSADAPAVGLIASNPPSLANPPEGAKPRNRVGERRSTYAPPESGPATSDDRYSPAAMEPSGEHRKRDNAGSMVIQVSSGESPEAAVRPLDRYDHREQRVEARPGNAASDAIPPAPIVDQAPVSPYGPAAGMQANPEASRRQAERLRENELPAGVSADSDAARRQAEKARQREFQGVGPAVDGSMQRNPYAVEPSRTAPPSTYAQTSPAGNVPNYGLMAAGEAAPGYAAPQGGYAPDRLPRAGGEFRNSMRAQKPLRDDGMYEVQPNDSYWTISERVYGSGAYFRALAEQNRGKAARPDRLPPGLLISTPPVAQMEKDYPDLCPRPNRRDTVRNRAAGVSMAATAGGGRTYVVQEGDTLSSIARNELGKVSRWAEIYQINRDALGKDYDYLTPGMRLVLPLRDSQSGDRTTRRDDGSPLMR